MAVRTLLILVQYLTICYFGYTSEISPHQAKLAVDKEGSERSTNGTVLGKRGGV